MGFVVVFSHIEDSGFYDCRVVDNADYTPETFQLMVNEDSESNENSSSTNSFTINNTFDVLPPAMTTPSIISSMELRERLKRFTSGGGNNKPKGVFIVVLWPFDIILAFIIFVGYPSCVCGWIYVVSKSLDIYYYFLI